MKLASYKDGSRDGQLVVVSRDLSTAHYANGIAGRLQHVLDDWNFMSPQLEDLYTTLNQGKARHAFAFDPALCMAPLPRAYQWVVATAYGAHREILRQPVGTEPEQTGGLGLTRGASDAFLGPRDDAVLVGPGAVTDSETPSETEADAGIDCEPGLAVISGDLPMQASPAQGLEAVRLLMLVNDWRWRHGSDSGPDAALAGRPATAFSPVALTPDELGPAWRGGRIHLDLHVARNGQPALRMPTGPDMGWHAGQWLALLARHRPVSAGTVIGSGPVSLAGRNPGRGCIAEQRAIEAADHSAPRTPYLRPGDRVRIEMAGADGLDLFGAIEQTVGKPD